MESEEKKNRKPNLYFSEEATTTKGYVKEDDSESINKEVIREHMQQQIKKEEKKGLATSNYNLAKKTAKLQIQRHEGALKDIRDSSRLNMASIKTAIQQKMRRQHGDVSQEKEKSVRVPTGIPGLDEVMEGGFRRNTVNLVGGGAGSGKSIFCMQFLVNGIEKYGESGVYISFEETPEELFEDMKRFGWNLEQKVKEKKLVILHYTPEQVEKVLEAGGGSVRDTIESIGAKRLVLDSVTAFTLLHETQLAQRKAALALFENIKKWGCTALVVSEQEPDPERHYSDIMEFEVDGVILLYNIRKGDIRERSLEVYKMRGVHHAAKIFPMKISDRGIRIFPAETVF
jgi:KaiC/GvpD/RAD55 family RecA-like ATPase